MSDEHTITGEIRDSYTDCAVVVKFGEEMISKLRKNAHRAHWSTVGNEYLFNRLLEEVEELREAMSGTDGDIVSECADCSNFCMMIADNTRNGVG